MKVRHTKSCDCGESFCAGMWSRIPGAIVHKHGHLPAAWWWPFKPKEKK